MPVSVSLPAPPEAEPVAVDEKALHDLMKDWRHGRASKTIGQVLGDAYFALFSLGLLGAMAVNLLLNSQKNMAGCSTDSCLAGRTLLPWVLLFCAGTLALSAARMFGPVLASAAEGFWLMDAPISRTRLLGGRLRGIILGSFGVGAFLGAVLTLPSGVPLDAVAGWALAIGLLSSALMAIAGVEQSLERRWVVRVIQTLFSLAAAATVLVMVLVSAGTMSLVKPPLGDAAGWVIAGVAAVVTVLFWLLAYGRLTQIRRARLLSGGSLVSGMQGAMFALDFGLARDILAEREAVERGHVRPTVGRGLGVQALVWRDVQRVFRFPKPLLGLLAAVFVPYAVDALGLGFVMPLLAALALLVALVPFLGSLRVLTRTGGLARMLPFTTAQIRSATMIVPAVLALVWGVLTAPAVLGFTAGATRDPLDAAMTGLAIAAAGLLGAVRWQTAKQINFNTPMMATNAGALPPGLIFNLFRGIDVCATVTAPIMLGAPPYWALAITAVWFFALRAGMNMEDLQEEAKEQQRQVADEKAGKTTVTKTKIARPQR